MGSVRLVGVWRAPPVLVRLWSLCGVCRYILLWEGLLFCTYICMYVCLSCSSGLVGPCRPFAFICGAPQCFALLHTYSTIHCCRPQPQRSCQQVSERNTWPKVEMIRSHCAVEMALEQCVQTLRRQLTAENQVSLSYASIYLILYTL